MSTLTVSRSPKPRAPVPRNQRAASHVILLEHDVKVPLSALNLDGFRAWAKSEAFPERGRFSFIGREVFVDMSPEELETHVAVKGEISFGVTKVNKKTKRGKFFPDGTLVTNVEASLSTEPDGTFVTWESLELARVRMIPRVGEEGQYMELEGSPDWIMEIVSKFSIHKDTKALREKYHRARIPEYWLVDARGEQIDFQILVWQEAGYVVRAGKGGWQASPVFDRQFRLIRRKGRMDLWDYTLQIKAKR
jgi:Uma2 family endonuclease